MTMFLFPVAKGREARITQTFGKNPKTYAQFGLKGHNGLDFAEKPEKVGRDILAIGNGKVIGVGDEGAKTGYGKYIKIQHDGFQSTYGHLSVQDVKVGDVVKRGQRIGGLGGTGFSTAPHLHLTLKVTDPFGKILSYDNGYKGAIDPLPFLFSLKEIEAQEFVVAESLSNGLDPFGQLTRLQQWMMLKSFYDRFLKK